MSLINDALRRARQAQQPPRAPETTEGPAFRTPLPPRTMEQTIPLLPAICLAAIGVTALIIAWNWKAQHSRPQLEALARSLPSGQLIQAATSPEQLPETVPAESTSPAANEPAPISGVAPAAVPDQAPATNPPAPALAAPVATPPAAAPKLQSIIYHPQRPSAMIDGKVLFVGDKLRDLRVIAITPTGATVVGPTGTNHLEL